MPYQFYNPNPLKQRSGDHAVRAISKILGKEWEETFVGLCCEGLKLKEMPESVLGEYLRSYGFRARSINCICPDCMTVERFTKRYPRGKYILATENNIVAVRDGDYFDIRDSGDDIVLYYYEEVN